MSKHKHDNLMYTTKIEVLCQNKGKTFKIESVLPVTKKTCWHCNRETFVMHLGPGKGNVAVEYYDANGGRRELDKIVVEDNHYGIAEYDATGGSFLLLSQELQI